MAAPPAPILSLIPTRIAGAPSALIRRADGRDLYLHSRFDPLEEARLLVKDLPRQERTLYVVLGFGLGYHVKELLSSTPASSRVIVIEPHGACLSRSSPEVAGESADAWMNSGRLHLLAPHDPGLVPINLAEALAKLKLLSISVMTHIPSSQTAPSFYRAMSDAIQSGCGRNIEGHLRGLDQMLDNELSNLWANLPRSWRAAPVHGLRGRWAGRPLIIVSAGPSLTDALPVLPSVAKQALVLATGTAARILVQNGVRPDLVISIDPFAWNAKHFQGWDCSDVPLVYYHRISRDALELHTGPGFCFVMHDEPPVTIGGAPEPSPFRRGGTVAYSALQLAHYLEADPVVFVGQDFAFSEGRTHAFGASYLRFFDPSAPGPDCFEVPGVGGRPVTTNRTFHDYLMLMQNYLLDRETAALATRHINTSRTGARIRGTMEQSLEETFQSRSGDCVPSANDTIRAAYDRARPARGPVRSRDVDRWRAELESLLHAAPSVNLDQLFAIFKETDVYAQAPRSYDDVYYVYECRYKSGSDALRGEFSNRFTRHLQTALDALTAFDRGVEAPTER